MPETEQPSERPSAGNPAREAAVRIARRLRDTGHRALFVGGCVRDALLGREPVDFDVATAARPEQVQALFPKTVAVGAQFGVIIVIEGGVEIEVATFRSEGPYLDGRHPSEVSFSDERQDVLRRDFTINGLLLDPLTGEVLDYVGGRADLAARVIRAIGDARARFEEDKLRLLRAVRFAAQLSFAIEPATWEAVRGMAGEIAVVSQERIRDEVLRILTGPNPRRGFELLHESGLLRAVLPEVEAMAGVPQPAEFHPEGDVWTHVLLMLGELKDAPPTLALGVLLHDAGKPRTMTNEDRIRFSEHERVGAAIAESVCRRLRLPNDITERVVELVASHMMFKDLRKMRVAKLKRFLYREHFDEILELHRLDCLASHRKLKAYDFAREKREELRAVAKPPPLLSGRDLIAEGYAPGPQFREMLDEVEDLHLEGKLNSREEALAHVRAKWPKA